MKDLKHFINKANSVAVYRNVLTNSALNRLLTAIAAEYKTSNARNEAEFDYNYSLFFHDIIEKTGSDNLYSYIENFLLDDNNIFTRACAANSIDSLSKNILNAVKTELEFFSELAALKSSDLTDSPILAVWDNTPEKTSLPILNIENINIYHSKYGYGDFRKAYAYTWNKIDRKIIPVTNIDSVRLSDLKEYQTEKDIVADNTLNFLNGRPAHNVLLYGDRGTGKSSTVHAILNEYAHMGLRIIELNKNDISDIKTISAMVARMPMKFIIFIDDLSFNESNDEYAELKALLEGSIAKHDNMLIYATTNRRHIIKERFSDREGDELHFSDTVEEQLSLSDRFGIVVTFINPSKNEFLNILKQILSDRKINIPDSKLSMLSEQFALSRGGRSPRIARQFADILQSKFSHSPIDDL